MGSSGPGNLEATYFTDPFASESTRAIAVHPDGLQVMVSTPAALMTHVATLQETTAATTERGFAAHWMPGDGPAQGVEFVDRSVVVRDPAVSSSAPVARFELLDGASPVSAYLSGDGTRLAVGDDRGRVTVWTIARALGWRRSTAARALGSISLCSRTMASELRHAPGAGS